MPRKFCLTLFVLLSLAPLARSQGTESDCYSMDVSACRTFYRTNEERARNGRPALAFCQRCFEMAQEQSDDMAERGYFGHDRPGSETFAQRAKRFGLERGVAENIAQARSPESAVDRWMKSEGHRRNILNEDYGGLAVGFRDGLYTQVFARPQK